MSNAVAESNGRSNVPADAIQIIDPAVMRCLFPDGPGEPISKRSASSMRSLVHRILPNSGLELSRSSHIAYITPYSTDLWSSTARLDTKRDGKKKAYFLKTAYGDRGMSMILGEFIAMLTIHEAVPDLVPTPISCGTYDTLPNVHFLLSDFEDIVKGLPNLNWFPYKLAELHRRGISPNGMFGFEVTTYRRNVALEHKWAATWEEYFVESTRRFFEIEAEVRGRNEEIEALKEPFMTKVVPRLLRPLETGGRSIKPRLIHGDLRHVNTAMDKTDRRAIVFDAASLYAHNEYELGVCRTGWKGIGESYMLHYHKHFPVSEPVEDRDDRNLLYATRVSLLDSISFKEDESYRERLIRGMKELVEKFPNGFEGWEDPATSSLAWL